MRDTVWANMLPTLLNNHASKELQHRPVGLEVTSCTLYARVLLSLGF